MPVWRPEVSTTRAPLGIPPDDHRGGGQLGSELRRTAQDSRRRRLRVDRRRADAPEPAIALVLVGGRERAAVAVNVFVA
jgi:hypothetical protein